MDWAHIALIAAPGALVLGGVAAATYRVLIWRTAWETPVYRYQEHRRTGARRYYRIGNGLEPVAVEWLDEGGG